MTSNGHEDQAWRFLDTGFSDAAFNMALDEALAAAVAGGKSPPTLRVYRWKPFAISLGYHQDVRQLDLARCARDGIDVVRRSTGGKAVLHAEELTYSVFIPRGNPFFGRTLSETYGIIGGALVRGLRKFGVPAQLARLENPRGVAPTGPSPLCFARLSRSEVGVNGKKLVGSAQRRFKGVVLQHGSILGGDFHVRLPDYLNGKFSGSRGFLKDYLKKNTVCLHQLIGPVDYARLALALKGGFSEILGVAFTEFPLTNDEIEKTEGLKKSVIVYH